MLDVARNIKELRDSLPKGVNLVAVSKFHPEEVLMEAYNAGQRVFGESRAQELIRKAANLPSDIEWHFIGHLQTNKVKSIIPVVKLIHSIDSEKLLRFVDDEARKAGRVVDVLLQLHVAKETTKFGMTCEECKALVASGVVDELRDVRIRGLMAMATNTDCEDEIRSDFRAARNAFDELKRGAMSRYDYFSILSMGMSEDYKIAIEEGSGMVRIGSMIFGERQY